MAMRYPGAPRIVDWRRVAPTAANGSSDQSAMEGTPHGDNRRRAESATVRSICSDGWRGGTCPQEPPARRSTVNISPSHGDGLPRIGGHHFRNLPLRLEFELDQRPFESERPRKEEMLMKKIILAAVAAAALCVPAVAQQSGQTQPGNGARKARLKVVRAGKAAR
jgi:hypothetical protein